MTSSEIYITGGTITPGDGIYIEREADQLLLDNCLNGHLSYVLTSRQMGKSSLMLHTAQKLNQLGCKTVILDLTQIGTAQVGEDKWYYSLLHTISRELGLETDINNWWDLHPRSTYVQLFVDFLHDATQEINEPIIIFIDEIEKTLGINFRDDFFAAIRSIHNRRDKPVFRKISFVLLGYALPQDIIQDIQITPFNIGKRVELSDFSRQSALPLINALNIASNNKDNILDGILDWTGGQPYLTQTICKHLADSGVEINSQEQIDVAVNNAMPEIEDLHIQPIREWLRSPNLLGEMPLRSLGYILENDNIPDSKHLPVVNRLKLIGVVKAHDAKLVVRNTIYKKIFNREWLARELRNLNAEHPQDFSLAEKVLLSDEYITGSISTESLEYLNEIQSSAKLRSSDASLESIEKNNLSENEILEDGEALNIEDAKWVFSPEANAIELVMSNLARLKDDVLNFFRQQNTDQIYATSQEWNRKKIIATALAGVAFAIVSWFTFQKPSLFWGGLVIGCIIPYILIKTRQLYRQFHFSKQLPEILMLLESGLRSGYSLMQAMETASKVLPSPGNEELNQVVEELQFGLSMEQALSNLYDRNPSKELSIIVAAINIQREIGGNISELLGVLSFSARERIRVFREMKVLSPIRVSLLLLFIAFLMPFLQWSIFSSYFSLAGISTIGRTFLGVVYLSLSGMILIQSFFSGRINRIGAMLKYRQRYGFISALGEIFTGLALLAISWWLKLPWYILVWLALIIFAYTTFGLIFNIVTLVSICAKLLYDRLPLNSLASLGHNLTIYMQTYYFSILFTIFIAILIYLYLFRPALFKMLFEALSLLLQRANLQNKKMLYFWMIKVLLTLSGLGIILKFAMTTSSKDVWYYTLFLGVLLFFLPEFWLAAKVARRENAVRENLPDMLDIITFCIEAGLGLDAALQKVSDNLKNELSIVFRNYLNNIHSGELRSQVLKNMSKNIPIPEMIFLTAAFIQADTLGVSLGKILRIKSEEIRMRNRQVAETEIRIYSSVQHLILGLLPLLFLIWFLAPVIDFILLMPNH